MNNESRLVLTIALCLGLLFGWSFLRQRYAPPPPPRAPAAASPTPGGPSAPPETADAPAVAPRALDGQTAEAPAARAPEQRKIIDRPGLYRAEFSTWGAAPVSFVLHHSQYQETIDGQDVPIDLIHREAGLPPFTVSFTQRGAEDQRSDFELPPDAAWELQEDNPESLLFVARAGDVEVRKRWTLPMDGYRLGLEVEIANLGSVPSRHHLAVGVAGWQDPNVKPAGLLAFGRRQKITQGMCDVDDKLHTEQLESLLKESMRLVGDVRWIGTGLPYFVTAVAFGPPEGLADARACVVTGAADGRIRPRVIFAERTVKPGERIKYEMAAFLGPKLLEQLDAVKVDGDDARLGSSVDYTFEFVARPMLWVLKRIQSVVVNWGVAIIIITILMKMLLLYPTHKSMMSMKEMAKLKPKIEAIKKRVGEDKARLNQETMALYKEHGINPLGGCLPMLFQMPIYIAFYSMLSSAVELYRAPFFGPIGDMTAPFWPMALMTGVLMFAQQKMMPTSSDPQQKMMLYLMPVMFTFFTVMLPAGLTIYILTNTVLTMLHQLWMNRNDPKPAAPAKA